MCKSYHLRRQLRETGISGLIFFSVMMMWAAYVVATSVPYDKRWTALLFTVVPWSLGMGGSAFLLVVYKNSRLATSDEAIVRITIFACEELKIDEITAARWSSWPLFGRIVLQGTTGKLTIYFGEYEREKRGELISFFRSTIPRSVQDGWSSFFYAHEQLTEGQSLSHYDLGYKSVRLQRRHADRCFAFVAFLVASVSTLRWGLGGQSFEFSVILLTFTLWFSMRFLIPVQGVPLRNPVRAVRLTKSGVFGIAWFAVGIATYALYRTFREQLTGPELILVIGAAIYSAVPLLLLFFTYRKRERTRNAVKRERNNGVGSL